MPGRSILRLTFISSAISWLRTKQLTIRFISTKESSLPNLDWTFSDCLDLLLIHLNSNSWIPRTPQQFHFHKKRVYLPSLVSSVDSSPSCFLIFSHAPLVSLCLYQEDRIEHICLWSAIKSVAVFRAGISLQTPISKCRRKGGRLAVIKTWIASGPLFFSYSWANWWAYSTHTGTGAFSVIHLVDLEVKVMIPLFSIWLECFFIEE